MFCWNINWMGGIMKPWEDSYIIPSIFKLEVAIQLMFFVIFAP